MRSAQSTQQKESELKNSRSCHICLKKQAEKNAACTVNSAERSTFKNQALTALEEVSSQIQHQASTTLEEITRIQEILQPSSRSKLWKVNKRNKIRVDSPTTKAKDHLPHEAPCGPISTFKIKPRWPLKKFQIKVQEQASTALEEISNESSRTSLNGP
ncbi:hypothetical protein EV2_023176 [Malus domestica]